MAQILRTTDAVIDALGGTRVVASMFGRTDPAASNWRKDGQFPSYTYFVLKDKLARIGKSAPDSLWSFAVETTQ